MADIERTIINVAAPRRGLLLVQELHEAGLTDRQILRRVDQRLLTRVIGPVLLLGCRPLERRELALACCLADPVCVAGWGVAADHWRVRGVHLPTVDVLRPDGRSVGVGEVRWRTMSAMHPTDVVTCSDGLRVTSPPLTLFHLAWELTPPQLESAIEDAINRRLVTIGTLQTMAHRWCRSGRPGSTAYREVIEPRLQLAPVGSELELRIERAVMALGIPQPVRQCAVPVGRGITFHLDLAWPDLQLGVEIDHFAWHAGREAVARDKQRDRWLSAEGWQIVRAGDDDIDRDVHAVANEIAETHRRRSADRAARRSA